MQPDEHRQRAGSNTPWTWALPALLLAFALFGLACGKTGDAPSGANAKPGKTTAETTPAAEQPQQVTVATPDELLQVIQKHRDKVVVLKFWATWCAPCVEEMPETIAFYNKHAKADDFAFVSVSADLTDSINDTVIPFVKEKQLPFPVQVIDAAGPDDIVAGLGIEETGWEGTLPAAFVFDKDGRLNKFWVGVPPEGALEETVAALLS